MHIVCYPCDRTEKLGELRSGGELCGVWHGKRNVHKNSRLYGSVSRSDGNLLV